MTLAAEIEGALLSARRSHPGGAAAADTLPWYLVVGEPGSGRTTAIHAMNLTWSHGEAPLALPVHEPVATYWLADEALFIEPENRVLGPARDPHLLSAFSEELRERRPRDPLKGIALVLDVLTIASVDERSLEAYAYALRSYLVEIGAQFRVDVPVYVVVTRYDTLWGFAEVFQWSPERRGEEPWGFVLPGDTNASNASARIGAQLDALSARFEASCLAKLASDGPPETRSRALQHLAEVRVLMSRLRVALGTVGMANAYERAPWLRALIIGSAVPGTGDRVRAGMARFAAMGLSQPRDPTAGHPGARPGGLPIHTFMRNVVLPEKDLVPGHARWRDDTWFLGGLVASLALWIGYVVALVVITLRN